VKIPDFLFVLINPIVRFLLKSPIHFFWSKSLLLITFTGRRSGKQFTTPVRFVISGEIVRCFTSSENQWWRNLRGGSNVVLRIEGREAPYHAVAVENDPAETEKWLVYYLAKFPQDAAYHDIRLNKDKSLDTTSLKKASRNAIVIVASPIEYYGPHSQII